MTLRCAQKEKVEPMFRGATRKDLPQILKIYAHAREVMKASGVFAFILGPDPTYRTITDGQWLNDTLPYGTIHRLASAGRQKGVATAVITWCLEHCESLRADTHADNKAMQHLLEKNGFTRCGIIRVEDGTPRIAYQRMSLTIGLGRR